MPGMLFHTALWRAGCQDRCRCQQGDKIQCATGTTLECLLTFISFYSVSYITADYLIISFQLCLVAEPYQNHLFFCCSAGLILQWLPFCLHSLFTVCPAQLTGFKFPVSLSSGPVADKPWPPVTVKRWTQSDRHFQQLHTLPNGAHIMVPENGNVWPVLRYLAGLSNCE